MTPYLSNAVSAHRRVSAVTEFLAEHLDATPLLGGVYHWDELAAVVATDKSVATIEDRQLVVAAGGARSGAIIPSDHGRKVPVAVDADPTEFEAAFYGTLFDTDEIGIPAWRPDAIMSWDGADCTYAGPDPLLTSMWIRIDNDSTGLVDWLLGSYDPARPQRISGRTSPRVRPIHRRGGPTQVRSPFRPAPTTCGRSRRDPMRRRCATWTPPSSGRSPAGACRSDTSSVSRVVPDTTRDS